jgi:type I restriction enzyme S subunit
MKQGWEIKKLGDVCHSKSSNVSQNQLANEIGDYQIFGASGLIKNVSFYHRDKPYLSIVKDGSGFGRVTKMDAFTSVIGTLQYILPNDEIDLDYLNYSLMSVDFKKYVQGAAIPHIYFKDYKNEPFLWMPLSEQQSIVSILDKAFAAIAAAKANAEQNLKNAKELFESYLQSAFANKGEGWEVKTLGEIATFRNGMNFTKGSRGEVIKLVGVRDFQKSFWVPFEFLESVTIDGKLNEYDLLQEGDIIAVRSNGNPALIGRTLLAGNVAGKVSHSGFTIRIRLNSKNISPIYVCHYLKTQKARKELIESGTGINIKSLNQGSLGSLQISFPKSLLEQQTIIQKLNVFSSETKKLEAIYQQKIVDLEELKKSVLQKAFCGELNTKNSVVALK